MKTSLALAASLVLVLSCAADPDTGQATSAIIPLKPVIEGTWASGLAPDALVGGYDNNAMPLYICHAAYNGSTVPGKIRSDWSGCDFAIANQELTIAPFATLVPAWQAASNGSHPSNAAYFGGYDLDGTPLYTCRASVGGIVRTGKLRQTGATGCSVGANGFEYVISSYDVLVNASTYAAGALPLVQSQAISQQPPPSNAIIGAATYGTLIDPCFAYYGGGFLPGWTDVAMNTCAVTAYGREYFVSTYQVLLPELVPVASPQVPFTTGLDSDNAPMNTCSAAYALGTQVGYVDWSGYCTFGYGGRGVTLTAGFNVLAVP